MWESIEFPHNKKALYHINLELKNKVGCANKEACKPCVRSATWSADTCCIFHSERTYPYPRYGRSHIPHNDTDSCLHHRITCTPGTCTRTWERAQEINI